MKNATKTANQRNVFDTESQRQLITSKALLDRE